jgi:hypothetical protein
MNKLGTVLLAFVALAATPAYAGKDTSFDKKFEAQVLKANIALRALADTPCTASTFQATFENFKTDASVLKELSDNTPDKEDDLLVAHQTELFIGFVNLATTVLDEQTSCLQDNSPKKGDVDPNAKNS